MPSMTATILRNGLLFVDAAPPGVAATAATGDGAGIAGWGLATGAAGAAGGGGGTAGLIGVEGGGDGRTTPPSSTAAPHLEQNFFCSSRGLRSWSKSAMDEAHPPAGVARLRTSCRKHRRHPAARRIGDRKRSWRILRIHQGSFFPQASMSGSRTVSFVSLIFSLGASPL